MANMHKRQGNSPDGRAWAFSIGGDAEVADFFEEFFTESGDRTAVIISFAYIENLLRQLLKSFLVQDETVQKTVFDPSTGAFSNVGAMADVAFLLGLISTNTRGKIKAMARVRNTFAHNFKYRNFQDLVEAKDTKVKKNAVHLDEQIKRLFEELLPPSKSGKTYGFRSGYETLFMYVQIELQVAISIAVQQSRTELKQNRTKPNTG